MIHDTADHMLKHNKPFHTHLSVESMADPCTPSGIFPAAGSLLTTLAGLRPFDRVDRITLWIPQRHDTLSQDAS
ncbi:MAG: hypothetical protein KF866_03920 [Phycisphaeraceae bacterium]|nr:hypothetical protein [Phycisphaeraceae bacterium]